MYLLDARDNPVRKLLSPLHKYIEAWRDGPMWDGAHCSKTFSKKHCLILTWYGWRSSGVIATPSPKQQTHHVWSLSHSYMLEMSMRLMCFSYPSWLATSRNSSVIRINPRSKLNSAGNFRIQYLKGIKCFWQPDFKLDLSANYGITSQIKFNKQARTMPPVSNLPSPTHHTESHFFPSIKDSPALPHWASFPLSPEGNLSFNSWHVGGNVYGEKMEQKNLL